jgi:UDPglucose 6-dehydrogenase
MSFSQTRDNIKLNTTRHVGFMGMGKLGLPCALACASKGHFVCGYDPNPEIPNYIKNKEIPYKEVHSKDYLEKHCTNFVSVGNEDRHLQLMVESCDIIFVPIQTPHDSKYEGVTRIPDERVDFDYTHLKNGIKQLAGKIEQVCKGKNRKITVIIISTVLPGTIDREIRPLFNNHMSLCYNPFFIAMGTTINDFLNPEFVLFGHDDKEAADIAEGFYSTLHDKPIYRTAVKNAELIKVSYNTFIGMKITFVNTLMEICHKTGCNVDEVTDALKLANDRLISTKYLTAGMGDGGGCHPRDNIAMSWLANELNLSHNFFDDLMMAREHQTDWLADLIMQHDREFREIYILGKSFKPETNIVTGSPAVLLDNLLKERGKTVVSYDPHVDKVAPNFRSGLYFIATQHPEFVNFNFPDGSTILDPWRFIEKKENLNVIHIGSKNE